MQSFGIGVSAAEAQKKVEAADPTPAQPPQQENAGLMSGADNAFAAPPPADAGFGNFVGSSDGFANFGQPEP